MLSTSDFLQPAPRRLQAVDLPVRGGQALVRGLLALEAMALSDRLQKLDAENRHEILATQLCAYLSDDRGMAILTPEQAQQAVALMEPVDLREILQAGQAMNSIGDKAVEAAEKN